MDPVPLEDTWDYPDLDDSDDVLESLRHIDGELENKGHVTVLRCMKDGQKVSAIRSVRQTTGWELPDAKAFVEVGEGYNLFSDAA